MKKILLFLTLFLSAVGLAQAAEKSYAIVFKGNNDTSDATTAIDKSNLKSNTYIEDAGLQYISSFSEATNVFKGKGTMGLKFGNRNTAGSFTIAFDESAQVIPTKIVVRAAKWDTSNVNITINDNRTPAPQSISSSELTDYSWEFTGTSALTSAMTSLKVFNSDKRCYIKSVTVYYEDGTAGGGEDTKDCGIAFTSASAEVTYPGTDYALPFSNDNKVKVTFSSSDATVASVDENTGAVTIVGCGTTTITATHTTDGTYGTKAVKFELTVIDPDLISATVNFDGMWKNDTAVTNVAIGNCSAVFANVSGSNPPKYYDNKDGNAVRMYSVNSLTINAPAGYYLCKIEFTGVQGLASLGLNTDEVGAYTAASDGKSAKWSAGVNKPTSVVFKSTGKLWLSTITVYYKSSLADNDAGLAFANVTDNATCGTSYTLQTLTNPKSVAVTWSSSNTEVADFNVDGTINIKKAGVTTITATATDAKYTVNNFASYTLTVIDTKRTDTFNASNLIFDEGSGYRNFTYTAESGAVYGGFADANESTLMIQNQASGRSGIFVSKAPKGYKLHTITVSTAIGSAVLTLYGSTKPYASVSTDGKSIATTESGKKNEIFVNGYTATLGAYGIIPTTFSICGADKASSVTEITVIWELDTRADAELAYSPAEVTLAEGEALTQPKLNNLNSLPVTYSSDREDVATVDAEGTISLAGGLGTAVITASTDGNASYKPASTTFTITVKKAQVAYLVTDVKALQPGDIVIIANQEDAVAFSTKKSSSNSGPKSPTAITLSNFNTEIVSISKDVMLFEVGNDLIDGVTYYTFKTTNYLGTDGYIGNSGSNNGCYVDETIKDRNRATVSINAETGEATINFFKGASEQKTYLTYNASSPGYFNCYAQGNQKPVYIYKLTDKPATVGEQAPDFKFADKGEKENLNVIVLDNLFETSTSATKVAVYMENVLVGYYAVEYGMVNAEFDHVPYLPSAKFTMRPVLAEDAKGNPTQLGPSAPLSFTWPNLNNENDYGYVLNTQKLFCVNEDKPSPWKIYGQFFFLNKFDKANLDYSIAVEVVDNTDSSIKYESEFVWGDGGFYVNIPNFFTSNKWDDATSHPDITECTVPVVKFIATPSYEFTYDTKYSSLVSGGAAAPARLTVPGATAVQTIVCNPQEVAVSTLTNSNTVSGVESVTVDANAPVEFFNLQGVRVDGDLAPGIYIRRQGQAVSKVQIR